MKIKATHKFFQQFINNRLLNIVTIVNEIWYIFDIQNSDIETKKYIERLRDLKNMAISLQIGDDNGY